MKLYLYLIISILVISWIFLPALLLLIRTLLYTFALSLVFVAIFATFTKPSLSSFKSYLTKSGHCKKNGGWHRWAKDLFSQLVQGNPADDWIVKDFLILRIAQHKQDKGCLVIGVFGVWVPLASVPYHCSIKPRLLWLVTWAQDEDEHASNRRESPRPPQNKSRLTSRPVLNESSQSVEHYVQLLQNARTETECHNVCTEIYEGALLVGEDDLLQGAKFLAKIAETVVSRVAPPTLCQLCAGSNILIKACDYFDAADQKIQGLKCLNKAGELLVQGSKFSDAAALYVRCAEGWFQVCEARDITTPCADNELVIAVSCYLLSNDIVAAENTFSLMPEKTQHSKLHLARKAIQAAKDLNANDLAEAIEEYRICNKEQKDSGISFFLKLLSKLERLLDEEFDCLR